ncbi:alpha/beta hydrolase [Streptomyces sp. ISL-1]|uniref:alpha/beta fold hydrolase n=1 Tax=Streptomyces sp. ISL-1 TaxID=2817657 RepID=UPI001BE8915D|nr:alpha/beta hydrolase [Streptomyces sp. ISL-1]MBT2390756.1 alpha/beta hydrolase [Streptomyces sp. ISL-1]
MADKPAIVLVHGGFVDGSGWRAVYDLLTHDGYHVAVVQNPTLSLQGDAAVARLIIDAQDGPVVLVGHSYGGAVITEAGTEPERGGPGLHCGVRTGRGRVGQHAPRRFPDRRSRTADPAAQGRLPVSRPGQFHASFAGDVPADLAAFMAESQVPWGVDALGGQVTEPAWRTKPSWYLITTNDKMIPPPAQRTMSGRAGSTTLEAAGSHSIYVSQPAAVADLIKQAASAVAAPQ